MTTAVAFLPVPPETPMLTARELDWHDRGHCQYTDPDLWFPDKGQPGESAKLICRQCPVRILCLGHAMNRGEVWGIWGGLSAEERAVARKFRRGGATLTKIMALADAGALRQEIRGSAARAVALANRRKARADMLAAGIKTCTTCKNVKKLSEFSKNGTGWLNQCKPCRSTAQLGRYHAAKAQETRAA